ncbi:AAA family ATPase [Altericista sp. CCNU0014]|uniref:AAA family ATPase n=1 Tax=Altericista sp. CCNU0014 TaxID=3082949 RepID=UPI00384F2BBE
MDLFEHRLQQLNLTDAPLAARMRPRTLDEFVGQDAIVGHGRLLRRAIQADRLSSLIFYGPPGTGKTTLAQIIANTTQAHFVAINAVLAGVKEIREAIATAKERSGHYGQRSILFVDEVHRFNKAQQDALLPWVENGTIVLIGATTENPYFEVNKALVSRSRLFQLKPLTADRLRQVAHRALTDEERGYGDRPVRVTPEALDHWVNIANGDARSLLNALELAVETTPPDAQGVVRIDLEIAEASIQKRAVLYDKEGDAHFDTISAFIKSLRGSDPDAALYWLARMVYAGEDPRFIFRRMLILASEDVGLADPQAVAIVDSCARAFDRIGLPEGQYSLAQAALYLATAPKSNRVLGYFDALAAVEREREAEVPNPLKDGNRDREGFGHGAGYVYPHAYREHWVAQQYLPGDLQGQVFYQPSDRGYEGQIRIQTSRRREAQLAVAMEGEPLGSPEILTYSPKNSARERWLQRTLSQAGEYLGQVRDRLFAQTRIQRHHVVLDLNAGSGLLTWEALRQVPEGGVYTYAQTETEAIALRAQTEGTSALQRPIVLFGAIAQVGQVLNAEAPEVKFDWIVGRNGLGNESDKRAIALQLAALLQPGGRIVLAETLPRCSQRLYDLIPQDGIDAKLRKRWVKAEEQIYDAKKGDSRLNWEIEDISNAFESAGFKTHCEVERAGHELYIAPQLIERWFAADTERLSYGDRLRQTLSQTEVEDIRDRLTQALTRQTVRWKKAIAYIAAYPEAF